MANILFALSAVKIKLQELNPDPLSYLSCLSQELNPDPLSLSLSFFDPAQICSFGTFMVL